MKYIFRFLILLTSVFVATNSHAEKRFALVVGNSTYSHIGSLPNAVSDADLIANKFRQLNFEVELLKNQSEDDFGEALDRLAEKADSLDVIAVYYAGHGIQKNGDNFLVPVDAKLKNESAIERETISLRSILQVLENVPISLLFLDACRDNPLAGQAIAKGRSVVTRGLAVVRPIGDMMITFATLPNSVASDGTSDNSPFATALAKHMETPNTEISVLMKRVTKDVLEETNGEQRPQQLSQMQKEFYFVEKDIVVANAVGGTKLEIGSILSVYPSSVKTGEEIAVVADVSPSCKPTFFNVSPDEKITPIPNQFFKKVALRNGQTRHEISPGSRYGLIVQEQDERGVNRLGFFCQPNHVERNEKKNLLRSLVTKIKQGDEEGEFAHGKSKNIKYQFLPYEIK